MMHFLTDDTRYVALVGLTGCGKSTFARLLADRLSLDTVDTDDLIVQQTGKTIPELFAVSEDHFRDCEERALASIAPNDKLVVSCGGGVIKRESCRALLKKNAIVVYIDRPPENIVADIDTSGRPLLKDGAEWVYRLYAERKSLYEEAADIIIPNNGTIDEALEQLVDAVTFLL